MINGTGIEQTLSAFNENIWTVFAVTISILVLTVYEMTAHPLWDWIRRPKIKIEPIVELDKVKDISKDFRNGKFFVRVKNKGKSVARNCKISMEFQTMSGRILQLDDLPKTTFPLKWSLTQDKKIEDIEIYPSHTSEGLAQIPLTASIEPNTGSVGFQSEELPHKEHRLEIEDIFSKDENKNRFYNIGVNVYVSYNSEFLKSTLLIKIKTSPFPILDKDISFTSVDTHSRLHGLFRAKNS